MQTVSFTGWSGWPAFNRPAIRSRVEFHAADRALRLAGDQHLRLLDAAGVVVTVISGAVWITQQTDIRDTIVEAGKCFELDRNGETLVAPIGCATVRLQTVLPHPTARRKRGQTLAVNLG